MTTEHRRLDAQMVQGILLDDPDFLHEIVERVLQELLEAEMTQHIGAAPHERTNTRKGHRNGYKPRTLRTRVDTLNSSSWRSGPTAPAADRVSRLHIGRQAPPTAPSQLRREESPAEAECLATLQALRIP